MKKIIAIVLLLTLCISLLAGCGNKAFIDANDAQKIALNDLGIKAKDADSIHIHVGQEAEGPAFSVHVDYEGLTYEYIILAANGEIKSVNNIIE